MKKSNKKSILAGISAAAITAALSLTAVSAQAADPVYGDANDDGQVTIADAAAILQYLGNKDKFKLSDKGKDNADVCERGDGITTKDAVAIQKYVAKIIDKLPESVNGGEVVDPVADATYITLKGTSIEVKGDNAVAEGTNVTITHSGTFYVEGTLDDGQICVNIPDEKADPETVKIFLNGANITGKSAPAILVQNAENTSINLVDGTENNISDGDTAYPDGGAVIEAKDDLTIKGGDLGTGILNLTANTQNGIVCNNDIKFNGGVVNIETKNKTDKTNGVNGKKSVTVKSGSITVDAEGDGIKSSKGDVKFSGGTTSIKAGNDAVQAETTIDVEDGVLIAGGDRGLTAVTGINITGGYVAATAKDNQVDAKLMSGTTQGTKLFNMAACPDSEDGTWKKDNTFGSNYQFTKKYKFVLISDPSYKVGSSAGFFVTTSDLKILNVVHGTDGIFDQTATVTAYDDVNIIETDGGSLTPTPQPESGYRL